MPVYSLERKGLPLLVDGVGRFGMFSRPEDRLSYGTRETAYRFAVFSFHLDSLARRFHLRTQPSARSN